MGRPVTESNLALCAAAQRAAVRCDSGTLRALQLAHTEQPVMCTSRKLGLYPSRSA